MRRLRIKENAKYGAPQNKREDLVWMKGYKDGKEVEKYKYRKIFWRFYWVRYPTI